MPGTWTCVLALLGGPPLEGALVRAALAAPPPAAAAPPRPACTHQRPVGLWATATRGIPDHSKLPSLAQWWPVRLWFITTCNASES